MKAQEEAALRKMLGCRPPEWTGYRINLWHACYRAKQLMERGELDKDTASGDEFRAKIAELFGETCSKVNAKAAVKAARLLTAKETP